MDNKDYKPTLAQLRTFVTIAENRHFGTAAQRLKISQPSLSQALVALENGLGLQLVERSTRRVIITQAGERLLPFAKATLEAADAFLTQSRGADGTLVGPLTVGIIPTIAPYILPDLLVSARQSFPKIQPRIVEDQTTRLVSQLRDGQIDLAILALPAESSGMIEVPLYTERFHLVLPQDHDLADREDLTLADLDKLDLLLLDDGHCLRDQIIDLCRMAKLNPSDTTNSVTRASSLTTILQLVAADLGTTLIPESAIATECLNPELAVASFAPNVTAQREVGLLYRSSTARGEDFDRFGELVTASFKRATARSRALADVPLHAH